MIMNLRIMRQRYNIDNQGKLPLISEHSKINGSDSYQTGLNEKQLINKGNYAVEI